MTVFVLVLFGIIAAILTAWFVAIPIEVVTGCIRALRHEGHAWKGWHFHHGH